MAIQEELAQQEDDEVLKCYLNGFVRLSAHNVRRFPRIELTVDGIL